MCVCALFCVSDCVCVSNFNGIKHEIRKSIDVDCCDIWHGVYGVARVCVHRNVSLRMLLPSLCRMWAENESE